MSFRRLLKRLFTALVVLAVLASLVAGGGFFWAKNAYEKAGPLAAPKVILFERGQGLREIAERLEGEGVITHSWVFKAAAVVSGSRHQLKAGEYEFAANSSMQHVMTKLTSGDVLVHKVTIPEGLRVAEIVMLLQNEQALVGDIPQGMTEGSLLPETYHFVRGDTRESILRRMQQDMQETLVQLWEKRDPALPLATAQEAVILASIVEKETGLASERPRVAAVFVNRLRLNMKLQSDPTVIFAVERDKGPLNRALIYADLEHASPFNTYYAQGLPPEPIANPGKASLAAVMNPPKTNELYFVADGTGGHAFAATLAEHNANVARWRAVQNNKP